MKIFGPHTKSQLEDPLAEEEENIAATPAPAESQRKAAKGQPATTGKLSLQLDTQKDYHKIIYNNRIYLKSLLSLMSISATTALH